MQVIGLTGQMGMGKSTIAKMLVQNGRLPFLSADDFVRELYKNSRSLKNYLKRISPQIFINNEIDKSKLREEILIHPSYLQDINAYIHPILFDAFRRSINMYRRRCFKFVLLEIPLLFEAGFDKLCDIIMVASAPKWVQKSRLLQRVHVSTKFLDMLLAQQYSDSWQRLHSHVIIETGLSVSNTRRQVNNLQKRMV